MAALQERYGGLCYQFGNKAHLVWAHVGMVKFERKK